MYRIIMFWFLSHRIGFHIIYHRNSVFSHNWNKILVISMLSHRCYRFGGSKFEKFGATSVRFNSQWIFQDRVSSIGLFLKEKNIIIIPVAAEDPVTLVTRTHYVLPVLFKPLTEKHTRPSYEQQKKTVSNAVRGETGEELAFAVSLMYAPVWLVGFVSFLFGFCFLYWFLCSGPDERRLLSVFRLRPYGFLDDVFLYYVLLLLFYPFMCWRR